MSSAFRGQAASVANPGADRYPLASVSRSALVRNIVASGAGTYEPSLLRADAWGHGAALISDVLDGAGLVPATPRGSGTSAESHAVPERSEALGPTALFGLAPSDGTIPVMRLSGVVLATKDLRAGEGVSYGYLYRAAADTRIALVTGGYAQGVVRALGGAADVTFAGLRRPIIGRVAMDVCVVEIADAAVRRGDEGVFFGDPTAGEPSVAEWREASHLTVPEIVTAVGLHAHRRVGR